MDFNLPYPPTFYMPPSLQTTLYRGLIPLVSTFNDEQMLYRETSSKAVWLIRNALSAEIFGKDEIGTIKAQLEIMHTGLDSLEKLVSHLRDKFLSEHSELYKFIDKAYKWDESLREAGICPGMTDVINNLCALTTVILNAANTVGFAKGNISNLIKNIEGMEQGAEKEIKILIEVQINSYEASLAKL